MHFFKKKIIIFALFFTHAEVLKGLNWVKHT